MKALTSLLIMILLALYKAENCKDSTPNEPSDCHNRGKSIEDQYRCCYVYQKYTLMGNYIDTKSCAPLTKTEFENIKEVIKSLKEGIEKMGGKFDTFDIKCSSNYLYISLLSLMIFLL